MPVFDDFKADAEVREILKSHGVFEAHRLLAEYTCYRNHPDGGYQKVLVRIYDLGPDNPLARYSWKVWVPGAELEPIPANPDASVVTAGYVPHWDLLDKEERRGPPP